MGGLDEDCQGSRPAAEIEDPPVVAPGVDQEVVAWVMCRRGEASIAVVDSGGRFAGLIPPDRMLEVGRETQAGTAIESSSVHDHGRVPQRNRLCSGQLAQAETTPKGHNGGCLGDID